mmetsp:Transcript_31071/g.49976  ORF Transcript_31071/g.49976 Transcript_31071/m.49976 type:complete len:1169 (-) Transcript_31071:2462-5968(-)
MLGSSVCKYSQLSMSFFGVFCILLPLAPCTSSHNWILSPSRSQLAASGTKPFIPHMPGVIHSQLGPGQKTAIKVSSAHSGHHRFVIFALSNEHYTYDLLKYAVWVDDYIDQAPASANMAYRYPRLHHCAEESRCSGGANFVGPVWTFDADYCEHPDYPSRILYKYKEEAISTDKFIFHRSNVYPWIIGALRFEILESNHGDHDVFCIPIPTHHHTHENQFVVHWFWEGYADAIDVLGFPFQVPENEIYGKKFLNNSVQIINHCRFTKPKRLVGAMHDASKDVSSCVLDVRAARASAARSPTFSGDFGVNAVPVRNDLTNPAIYLNISNGPWDLTNPNSWKDTYPTDYIHMANNANLMKVSSEGCKEATSIDNWEEWLNKTVILEMRLCSRGNDINGSSFKEATVLCANTKNCNAIAWRRRRDSASYNSALISSSDNTPFTGKNHQFRICEFGSHLEEHLDWRYYERKPPPATTTTTTTINEKNDISHFISFQPIAPAFKGSPVYINLTAPWTPDIGSLFGQDSHEYHHGNYSSRFGWKCPMGMGVSSDGLVSQQVGRYIGDYRTGKVERNAWNTTCTDGTVNEWSIEVPTGVYKVTVYVGEGGIGYDGCVAENSKFLLEEDQDKSITFFVNVIDGKLTLKPTEQSSRYLDYTNGANRHYVYRACPDIHWISIEWFTSHFPQAWVPRADNTTSKSHASSNIAAFWERDLGGGDDRSLEEIGVVSVHLPGIQPKSTNNYPGLHSTYTCAMSWFFQGGGNNICMSLIRGVSAGHDPFLYVTNRQGGGAPQVSPRSTWDSKVSFAGALNTSHPDTGVLIYLSNATNRYDDHNRHICGEISKISYCEDYLFKDSLCTLNVNCGGVKARFVRIQLLGQNRILALSGVDVFRKEPPKSSSMICYGVELEAQEQRENNGAPQFVLSSDPSDPIFYSSCYLIKPTQVWLPYKETATGGGTAGTGSASFPWVVDGGKCLNCSSLAQNYRNAHHQSMVVMTPRWWLSDDICLDCTYQGPHWEEVSAATKSPTIAPTQDNPGNEQGSTPTPPPSSYAPTFSPALLYPAKDDADTKKILQDTTFLIVGAILVFFCGISFALIFWWCLIRFQGMKKKACNRKVDDLRTMNIAARESIRQEIYLRENQRNYYTAAEPHPMSRTPSNLTNATTRISNVLVASKG